MTLSLFLNFYSNQHPVHGISHILSSWEPSSRKRDLGHPLAVLLPVIMELIFPPVEDSINLTSPHEPDSTELVPYPAWGGEYSDILQSDTCSIDNILAIISSNKTTITKSLELNGTTPSETKFTAYSNWLLIVNFKNYETLLLKKLVWKSS